MLGKCSSFAKRIQWESILAGALGLAGGLLVIESGREQIASNEKLSKSEREQFLRGEIDKHYENLFTFMVEAECIYEKLNTIINKLNSTLINTERQEYLYNNKKSLYEIIDRTSQLNKNISSDNFRSQVPLALTNKFEDILKRLRDLERELRKLCIESDFQSIIDKDMFQIKESISEFRTIFEDYRNKMFSLRSFN